MGKRKRTQSLTESFCLPIQRDLKYARNFTYSEQLLVRTNSHYSNQSTSLNSTKVSKMGNTNRGNQSHIHCSRLIFAAVASTNATSEAIKPPISAIAPRSPIQLSEMASDPPLENATMNIAPVNASSTTTAVAIPTAYRAKPLLARAALVFVKVWGETELPVIELTSFANPPRGADGLCESRFLVSSRWWGGARVLFRRHAFFRSAGSLLFLMSPRSQCCHLFIRTNSWCSHALV